MNSILNWAKRYKVLSGIIVALFVSYLWYDMPFKATDPSSPYFVESLFRMRDYGSSKGAIELRDKVIPKLFPVDTPKEYVDLMLRERGGAHIVDATKEFEGHYAYFYTPLYLRLTPDLFIIRVYYDKENKVEAIHFAGKMTVGEGYKPKKVPYDLTQPQKGDQQ